MSAFSDVREIVPQRIWDGLVARSVHGSEATFAVLNLDPNIAVPEHAHANEQIGILLSGSVSFDVGGERKELAPGAIWVIPPHVPHSVDAGPGGAAIIEIFAPPRHDWAAHPELAPGTPSGFSLDNE